MKITRTKIKRLIRENVEDRSTARKVGEFELRLAYEEALAGGGDSDAAAAEVVEDESIIEAIIEKLENLPALGDLLDDELLDIAKVIFRVAADDFLSMTHQERMGRS